MKNYIVKAYADVEYGLKEQKTNIAAENLEQAKAKAYKMFDECKEIGVWEVSE